MYKLAWHEAKEKYWRFDMVGIVMSILPVLLTALASFKFSQSSGMEYIFAGLAGLAGYAVFLICAFVVTYVRRLFYTGYLRFNISYRNGIAQDCICVNIESLEAREHYSNLHFNCYGRFLRVWDAKTNETIISNNTHSLSFAPQTNSGKSFQYGNIPDGDNVIYFAKVENGKLVFFTTASKLISLNKGIYNVDLVLGGICKELDKCIRPVTFKGRVIFDGEQARLERRKWLSFPNSNAAEQSVHLTGGDSAPLQAVSKPRKNPTPKRNQRPPTRK